MLRAYNAEADNLVQAMKPYKLQASIERLDRVAQTIERLGRTMSIRISRAYHALCVTELELTADHIDKVATEKAGYVYVISNIGAFGERMIKVGMTRRLDPMDRVRELGDASVPFRYDVHALYFSADAVGIETAMHARLADRRVNRVNLRREFFYATPDEARCHLLELAGDLLEFTEVPEALEFRQSRSVAATIESGSTATVGVVE